MKNLTDMGRTGRKLRLKFQKIYKKEYQSINSLFSSEGIDSRSYLVIFSRFFTPMKIIDIMSTNNTQEAIRTKAVSSRCFGSEVANFTSS